MGCGSSVGVASAQKELQPTIKIKSEEIESNDVPLNDVTLETNVTDLDDDKSGQNESINVQKEEIIMLSAPIKRNDNENKELEQPSDNGNGRVSLGHPGLPPELQKKESIQDPPKRLTVEEKIEIYAETIRRLENATDYLAEEYEEDLKRMHLRFSPFTRKEDPKVNLFGIENGAVDVCYKVWKNFFAMDFLDENDAEIWKRFKKILVFFWNGSDRYTEFCERLFKLGAHSFCLEIIQDPRIVDTDEDKVERYTRQIYMVKAVFGVLHNMLHSLGESVRSVLRDLDAVKILQTHLESKNTMIKVKAFINLAYLITEEENEIINADDAHIQYIVDLLQEAVASKNRRSKRGFAALETVEALNRLAVNDKNKERILDSGALAHYERLLLEGVTEDEQIIVVRGLWILAFHPKCRDAINGMSTLQEHLKKCCESGNPQLVKAAKGALWVLEGGHSQKESHNEKGDIQHIMISYNWGVKSIVLKIRDRLIESGYKVWMDIDNMTGSTLEAMAEAVERAAVVVICMTQKYKESPSCRTEAEYTYQLRKPFIPLRLEKGYKADGWLGIMTGTKLWFDFIRNFEAAMVGLIKELGNRGKLNTSPEVPMIEAQQVSHLSSHCVPPPSTGETYKSWSEKDVAKWLQENGLGHQVSRMSAMDGALLKELHDMRRDAPDFFYSSLRDDLHFTMIDILRLTKAMGKL